MRRSRFLNYIVVDDRNGGLALVSVVRRSRDGEREQVVFRVHADNELLGDFVVGAGRFARVAIGAAINLVVLEFPVEFVQTQLVQVLMHVDPRRFVRQVGSHDEKILVRRFHCYLKISVQTTYSPISLILTRISKPCQDKGSSRSLNSLILTKMSKFANIRGILSR